MIFDMETSDPDDFLTLLLLADHPWVELDAVTITPGTPHQVGLVRWALERLGKGDIPVGAGNLDHPKPCVSAWHYKTFGDTPPSRDALSVVDACRATLPDPDASYPLISKIVTGGPLKNVATALEAGIQFNHLFAQGGFAGEGVVPFDKQLEKFKGMTTCPTFNLNGAPAAAERVLKQDFIGKYFISKNVCHGVVYDSRMHDTLFPHRNDRAGLMMIHEAMDRYLAKKKEGKKLHDPLAACCAIDPGIGLWEEVMLYREGNKWGSRKEEEKTDTFIIVDYDHDRFVETIIASDEIMLRRSKATKAVYGIREALWKLEDRPSCSLGATSMNRWEAEKIIDHAKELYYQMTDARRESIDDDQD